jgi:para-nitrobenzyl esterase
MPPFSAEFLSSPRGAGIVSIAARCLVFGCAAAISAAAVEPAPVATVTGGQVRGRLLPDGRSAVFKGLPFAQPPVGKLRWREPRPVVPWDGVRDARESGPPAAQPRQGWNDAFAAASREDCLYLDVWTPNWQSKPAQPVMLWIHGGANVAGAGGADPLYDGSALINRGVVLVVIEYRLGIFGFFGHPELTRESPHHASGNYGILDQIAALQWVHDNIAQFGGDPGNVTIFGQSAGSIDVLALMASPLSKGLFHRAIGESGALGFDLASATIAQVERAGLLVAEKLKAPSNDTLRYLRSCSTGELLTADREAGAGSGPNTDGWVLPAPPVGIFATGREQRVPLIIGGNAIELPAEGSPDDLKTMVRVIFGELAPQALALYGLASDGDRGGADPVYGGPADQLGSDLFRCPAMIQGEWHSTAGNPTWEYQFDRAIPPRPRTGHSSDLPYVFGNLYSKGSQAGEFQDADRSLSATIQSYWTNFAKTGDPNGPGLPAWPKYDGKTRKYLEFTGTATVVVNENQRGPFGDLFREILNRPGSAR